MSADNPFKKLVTYELTTPEFLKRLQCSNSEEGEDSTLFCIVIGDPVPTIKWYNEEGTELTDSGRYKTSYDLETGQAELIVKNTEISDEMSYKCVASNEHGTSKTIGVLVIKNYKRKSKSPSPNRTSPTLSPPTQPKLRGVSPLKNIDVPISNLQPVKEETEVSSESATEPKETLEEQKKEADEGCKIITPPQEKFELKEGEDFKICCNIIGSPEPEVLWFKDNHPLKDDYRIDIYSDRGNRFLEICDAKLSDSGEYTIFVRNQIKQVNATSKVIVTENPQKADRPNMRGLYAYNSRKETYRPPQFITKPDEKQRVKEGNSIKISTQVQGTPKPVVSWFKEGKPIKLDEMRFKSYELDGIDHFEIDNLSILDTGEYTCTASNVMGAIFCTVELSIEAMTEPESNDLSSEFQSDVEKSTNEYGSVQGSVSDNNSENNAANKSRLEKQNKQIVNDLLEKHVTEHIYRRLNSVDGHSENEKETLLREYKLLKDYKDEEREISLFQGDIVEIVDVSKAEKWLVRSKYANLIQVCYVPPDILEAMEVKPKLSADTIGRKKNQNRKPSHKVPKSEKILFGESIGSSQSKMRTIVYNFDDSNTIYTKAGKSDSLYKAESNTSLGALTLVDEPIELEKPTTSTVAVQMSEVKTTSKVTEISMVKTKKYDSSTKGFKVFESKLTDSKTLEQKTLDHKVIESKAYESKGVELKATEITKLETKSIDIKASEVKNSSFKGSEYTSNEARSMETNTIVGSEKSTKTSIEQNLGKLDSKLNKSLPDLAAGTSRKAASHKKFIEFQNRRQHSHDSDLNNLGSSSSSEDLNKNNMAEEADIYYASCDFTSTDLQNASATFLSLLENQFVEILDSQDPHYYLVRTRPRKDEKPKIGWIPACFLERKSTAIGQVNRRTTREVFRDDLFQIENKQQEAAVKRKYSYSELIEMERVYTQDLQFVIENYLQELSRLECPKQIKEKRDFIFANIEDIFAFHKVLFYAQLAESEGDVDRLSRIFLKNRNNFELYVPYSVNRQFSESTLNSFEIIRKFFDDINLKNGKIDDWISDYLNKPLDRLVQYRQFIQEQIKYTVRAKQNSTMLQEVYFMFCDLFKIIETRQLVNSILNLPLELLSRLEKLSRFDAFYVIDADNRLRERFLFLFKDCIIVCRLKPRTTTETIANANNNQLSSIVSGSVSLANYFKGALYFKSFVPLSAIKSIKMDNFDESDEKLLIEINFVQAEINESLAFVFNSTERDPSEAFENLFLYDNSRLLLQAKNPYAKLAFIKALKNNLICLGYLEETLDTLSLLSEELIHSTITSITNNFMPRKRKHISKKRPQDKSNIYEINEYTPGSLTSLNKIGRGSTSQHYNITEHEDFDESSIYEDFVDDGSVRRYLAKSPVTKTRYEEYQSATSGHSDHFPVVHCCSTSPVPTSDNYMSATSRQSGRHKSRSKSRSRLNANEILSTDFYSFESTAESYHTADDFEESKPHFSKQLTSISCYEGDTAILECTIAGNPPADMKWYRWDNTLIHDSPDFIYLREKNNVHKLVIREAIPADSGVYKLVASNIHGQAVSTCKVYVKEDLTDHDDTIIDQLNFTELQYRSDNTDNDVFEEEYLHISEDNSAGSPVMMSSQDFYETASSRGNSRQKIRRVITPISEHQTKPKFLKLFESHTVNESSALLLQCQVFGEPMPTIVWHKDGRELRNNGRIVITHSNNGASQLFISRTLVDDAGVYQVTASNDHGIAVYHSEVSVKPSEDFANNVFISNYYQQRDSDMLTSNDVFRKTREFVPERVASTGEQVAKLKCQVSGENVQVNWLKNESLINIGQNSRYRTINEGNERVLIVNDVKDVDDGEYICQSGKYRVTLLLNVNEEPENVFMSPAMEEFPIYFSDDHHFLQNRFQGQKLISPSGHKFSSTKDIYINQGVKNAELKCKVLNENTRVEWLKNNHPLQTSNKYEVVSRGTDRILLIKNPVKADDGDYVCQSGIHKVTLNLTVNPGTSGITPHMYSSEDDSIFVRNNQRTTGKDTELVYFYEQDAVLKCQVCNESEQVVWLKENTHVPFNQAKYSMVEDGAYRILNVKNLEPRDSGNYFCQSSNNKASTIGFKLNVKAPKTELFEPLKDIKVSNSGDKVVFEIVTQTPRSIPPSKVKWYKDGMEVNECTDSRYTVFSYFNDNKADGAVLNFNKLVIDPPLSQQYDQGEYKVVINSELSSTAHLYFDHSAMGFKPEIANVKKSQLQGFQNLITTTANNQQESFTSQATVPMATKPPNELSFVKELEAFTEVVEGHDCVLECIVNRFETKALWYIENQQEPIHYGNTKYELLNQDGRKHKLIIRKATPNDNALYTCRINDQIQTNTFVTVSEDVPLKIVEGLPELVHVPEHESGLELSLVMNKKFRHDKAHGTLIRWYLNKKEMKAGPDYQHFCVDNRIVLKYLREILYASDNNANIECRVMEIKPGVHNVELVSKSRMVVDQIGQEGAFIKKLDDFAQCDSGLHLDLEVRVNFNPQLVKWFKNNAQIMSDQHYQLMDDPINRSYILRLKCARLKDSGVYTVDVDGLQCSGEVKVIETPLQFIQMLQDQFFDLENDTSLTLDCQLNKPPAQFNIKPRWFKNDLEIVVSGGQVSKYDIIEEHNIVALIIYDLEERDEGRYRCQIGNESTQCRVKPEYILTKYLPNYIEQRETENTTLSFAVNRPLAGVYSTPVTKWFKDSHQINEAASNGKYSFIEQGTERTLVIHNCTPADSGLYKAYIVDESAEEPVNLVTTNSCQVQVKKLKVDFIAPLEPTVNVYEDETVKLYCEVLPENLKPQWFINDVPINPANAQNKEMYSTQTQHFLIINNAKKSIDAGIYKVKFGNDQISACQVIVHKKPGNENNQQASVKPEFVLHLKDVKCNEGDDFLLEAGIHRSLTSTDLIEWKKNGEFLVNSVGNSLNRFNENLFTDSEFELSCSGNKCTLSFKNARRQDAGQYEINIVELDAIPEPGREPMVMKSKCTVSITSYVEKSEIVKPLVKTLKVNEGETIRLDCSFNKRPERVEWTRNGQLLAPIQTAHDSCVKISDIADGKTQTLEITLCHIEHEGTYQIAADDKIAICEVKIKPVMAQFVQRPPDSIVYDTIQELEDNNDTCSIECTVDKKNAVVKWYKGNQEIIPGQTVDREKFEIVNEGPIRCLLIHDVNEEDGGDYFCSLGSDFSQTKLTVIEAKPAVIEPKVAKVYEPKYEKIDVYEGKGLVMGIDLDSSEQSQKCQWFKSEQPLDLSTSHIISKVVDNKKHTLKIDKLVLADTGRFELIMTEGSNTIKLAAIDLNVMEKPIAIVKKLNAQKVQNNLLLLECEVNKPITAQFKYAWFKDNVEITSDDDHLSRKIVEGTKCRLFINKFDYVDSGTYEFTIHDPKIPELKESTSFRLDIKQNPFKSGMRVVNGDFSQTRILTIEFETVNDKFEVTDMKWLKDNIQMDIVNNPKYNFVKSAPCKFTLEIKDVGSVDNGAYNCMIDEFTNKLNLSGIENVENQAISEEIEEAVEELAEVIESIGEAKNAQANIIDELQDILDKDDVDKSQVLTHASELVEKEKSVHKLEDLAEEETAEPVVVEPVETKPEVVAEKSNLKKTESLVSLTEEVNAVQEVAELAPVEEKPEQVKAKSVEKPELEKQETKAKEPTMVKEAEANEPTEEVTEIAPVEESKPEQVKAKSVEKPELEKQETKAKEPVKVEPVEEVNPEEKAEELPTAEKPSDAEKAAETEVKESEDIKQAEEVKETKRDVEVVKSTWSPEIKLNEGDALNLEVTVKAAVKPADVIIYKNGVALKPSEYTVKKSGDNTDIKFNVKKAKDSDKGDYKLCLKGEDGKEQEIQASSVKVEKPLSVKAGLKSTKGEYVEGEDIELAFETTKPLADKEKCIQLMLGTKTCTITEEHYEVIEEIVSEEEVIYKIKVKACEAGKDDGTYKLKLFGKPGDKKSELSSSGQAEVKIKSKPISVLDSNWSPELTVKESEPVTLNVTIDKVLPNADSLVLTKDGKPVKGASIEVTKLDDNSCQITYHIPSAAGSDSGNYKLSIAGKDKKAPATDLAETKLVVEVTPFSVVAPLTADKAEYAPKEDAVLTLTLSKKVESIDKCLKWTLNSKALEMKAVELTEAVGDNNNVSYVLKVKNVQSKKNDGEYTVRIKEKSADKKELTESVKVKILDATVKVLNSTWKPETSIKEGETLELSVTISMPLKNINEVALLKDKAKVGDNEAAKLSFENKKDKDGNETCVIKVTLSETIPPDSGKYRLVLTNPSEQELATTNLKVKEIPLAIVDALKCDKPEYQVGEDIKVSFNLSKPLSDKDKCIAWQLNGKPLDVSAKNKQAQLTVEDKLTEGCLYTLTIKACELGKNDGEYTVKLRQKPSDAKSEFYTGSVNAKINDGQLSVLESNWKPETNIKEGEQLEYTVVVSKACNIKDLILLKDKNKLIDSEAVKLFIENKKAEDGTERCEIKMTIKDAIPPDSGKYRLVFVDHASKKSKEVELGATNLKVEETPYTVVEELKSDKNAYKPGDDITLSIKLSKPLIDKQKNVTFALNGKTINIKDITLVEDISESLETVYSFIIKSAKPDLHDGEYTLKLCSKVNDVKSQFYSGSVKVAFEQDESAVEFASNSLEANNMKPKEGENVKITAKLTKPMNTKAFKIQWYVNNEKADKSSRYVFNSPSDLETCFEVKPVRSAEEGALIQAVVVKLKDNAEVARATLQLEKNIKLLSDLKASKAKYEQDEPVEFSCEFNKMPLSLVLSKSPKEPKEVLSCEFDPTKESQKIDIDAYTVQLDKLKDGSYKLKVTNNKPSFKEDNDKFWLALNGGEISTNECKVEIKQAGLKFAGDISATKVELIDSKDKLELCFALNRAGVTVDEIKSDVQAILKREGSTKEDIFLAGNFELAIVDSADSAATAFKLTMKQTVSENDSGEYTLKLKSSGDKSPNAVKINVENSNFFLSELPASIEIFEGELLKLELKCIKIVTKFSWVKDGAKLTVKEDKYKKDKLVYAYEVKSAKSTDAGVYEFHCEEGSGKAFTKCSVTVKTKPEKLLKSLNDLGQVKVKEGETINLKVKFDREVKLDDLKLTLNDSEFVPADHGDQCEIKLNKDNEYTVQIKGAKLGRDDGNYKLVSKNTESECSVVIEEKPLKFISELEHCRLKVLPDVFYATCDAEMAEKYPREASFECNLSSACTEVDWYINDTLIDAKIKDASRYTASHVLGKAHTLTIADCVLGDTDSTVEIRLRNAKSPMKSKAQLKVEIMSMEQFIKVNMPLKDTTVAEKQTATFECQVAVSPVLSTMNYEVLVKWQRDGKDLPETEKFEYLDETDEQNNMKTVLTILDTSSAEDKGEYSVHFYVLDAEKTIPLTKSTAKLAVKEGATSVVKPLPESLEIVESEGFELECELSKPDLKVKWTKDGKELKSGKSVQMSTYTTSDNHYAYKLTISAPSDAKEGSKYKLAYESISTECKIVLKKPKLGVKTPLSQVSVKEGEKAALSTEYNAPVDADAVEWFKNGKAIDTKSGKYQVQIVKCKVTLVVSDCLAEDAGDYEIKVKLDKDQDQIVQSATVKVVVAGAVVLESLSDVTVEEGETAKLSFKASKSCQVTWYKVSEDPKKSAKGLTPRLLAESKKFEKVTANDRVVCSSKADNSYGLTIHECQAKEAGFYLAHLSTGASDESVDTVVVTYSKLTVKDQVIDISDKFSDSLSVNEGESMQLKCRLSKAITHSSLVSRIKITKDGKTEIKPSTDDLPTRYQLSIADNGELTITVEKAALSDEGLYTLKLDKQETKCKVKVLPVKKQITSAPKIVKDLDTKAVEFANTEPFTITVTVRGEQIKAEWFRDGKAVVPTTNQCELVQVEGENTYEARLNFETPFTSDSGKYYCKLSNPKGSVTSKTLPVTVKDSREVKDEMDESLFQSKPRFVEYFSDVNMELNKEAQFKCKIIGKPEPKVVWSCNCSKITANEKFEVIRDGEYYTLVVKNVGVNDEGEYTCKASNTKGEATWSANLYLNEASKRPDTQSKSNEIAPNFLRKIKDSTVSEGSVARFDCFVDGLPFPKITWYINNSPVDATNTNKYQVEVDSAVGKASLAIFDCVKQSDEAEYMIKLENSAGVSDCSAFLVVEVDDANKSRRKVRFSSPKDTDVYLIPHSEQQVPKPPGQPEILNYNTTNLLLKWQASPSDICNYDKTDCDIEAQSNVTYVIEYRTSKTYSWSVFAANIKSLSTFVDGLYPGLVYSFRVRAENSSGISDCSPAVSTKNLRDENEEEPKELKRMPSYRRGQISVGKKPSIIGDAHDVRYYIEGRTAQIDVEVNGFPTPTVKWVRKDVCLTDTDNYKIYHDKYNMYHLDIANASESDEGLYQIVASNEYGQCVHDIYLQQADPPVFLEPFKDVTVENHQDVEMICKVDGIPYPEIKFYKDWHLLAESYRIRIKHVEPDTWIITIKGAIVRDSGLYTCTAQNIAGGTLCSCNLTVAESLLNLPHPDLKTDLVTFKRKVFEEDYEIVEELGQSINSKIYRVIERRTAKEFLAKVAGTQEYSEWIKTEADCLNQLHHITDDCFIKMHDAYETPSKRFILIFEEIKGKNLFDHMLSDQVMPDDERSKSKGNLLEEHKIALHIKKVLEALNHLHSRNIVHLDINPENIIVDNASKKIKLVGFTHSKNLRPDVFLNSPRENVFHDYGQPEFVAPEIVLHRPVTLNTDMWSLGVMTYELLTGVSPFFGLSMKETLENIVNADWTKISDALGDMSHDAKDFIQRLFMHDPKDRMTSEQALNHPWIHRASQQYSSTKVNRDTLMQLHSRHIWAYQTKQKQPWLKTQRISTLLDSVENADTGISSGSQDSLNNRSSFEEIFTSQRSTSVKKKMTRFASFDDQVYPPDGRKMCSDDEGELAPGTYLLPVRDPLFTVRVREYRRSRFEKLKSQASFESRNSPARTSLTDSTSISMKELSNTFNGRTVKERYHIDAYGKCIQRGSLSRLSSNLRSSTSMQRSQSRASSVSSDILERPFKSFLDYKDDKRYILGEGSAPLIREKLKDNFLIVGAIVTMRCRIEGNPTPRCFWYHNDRLIIGDDERFKFAQAEDGVITLSIMKARVSDIGVYRCAARNRFGCSITSAKLTVGDSPDKPTRPIVSQFTSDQVYLIWESPNFNGNSDILCYKVDYKISGDVKWSNALFTIEESCIIKGLLAGETYRFRVSCINTIGVSSYSWGSEEVTMLSTGSQSTMKINHEQAEKLLQNQYNLEKRSQQLVVVRKLEESLKDVSYKNEKDTFKIQADHNPSDLYQLEDKTYQFGSMKLFSATDKANKTKRLIKFDTRKNENEIKILRGLSDQDRLVQLIEGFSFKEGGQETYAFVYSYAMPVTDFLTIRHKYSEELVVKILRQVVDAVQWLHLHGFVHLNIHPSTILNTNYTQVNIKLGGFENSHQISELDETEAHTSTAKAIHDSIIQPIEFAAPEVLNKEPLSMATDIWNIGVFAALLLSGASPFLDHTDPEITKANITFCRLTFDEFYDDVTGEAVLFIQQCLKRSPSNRLTLQQCIDHKLFNLSVSNSRKRENILFLTEKLKSFSHEFAQRL